MTNSQKCFCQKKLDLVKGSYRNPGSSLLRAKSYSELSVLNLFCVLDMCLYSESKLWKCSIHCTQVLIYIFCGIKRQRTIGHVQYYSLGIAIICKMYIHHIERPQKDFVVVHYTPLVRLQITRIHWTSLLSGKSWWMR